MPEGRHPSVLAVALTVLLALAAPLPLVAPASAGRPARPASTAGKAALASRVTGQLPRLVDLGADKCIPCKKMAPILEALRNDYAGAVEVVFLDVWKNPKAADPYHIRLIPTQIFFDRAGRERGRHEGFIPREEIERIFRDSLGVAPRPAAKR